MIAGIQWFPLMPPAIVLLVCAALLAVLAYGSWLLRRKHIPRRWVILLGALRVAMVLVLAVGLLQPVLSWPHTTRQSPDVLVLVDASASMARPSADGEASRFDELRRVLHDSPAVASAAASHNLHWFTFDRYAQSVSRGELDQAEPRGETTDLAAGLVSAWNHVRLESAAEGGAGSPSRVLLVSDGQDHGAEDAIATARELGLTVDVLAPKTGSAAAAGQSARIADVQSARRVLLGSETSFQLTLQADSAVDGSTLVTVLDGREVERRAVGALAPGASQRVMLTHRPADPGLKRYTFRLLRGDQELGRTYSVNVQVVDDRHDVLMLEDTWRWDFKYLRRILEDDPSFSFTAMLSRGNGAFVQFGEPERRVQLGGFPQSRSELDGFDTIILGDVHPASWPRGLARNMRDAVSDGGKSLVVIAGPRLGEWLDVPELAKLLPVELRRESGSPIPGPVEARVTPEGVASAWFSLDPRRRSPRGDSTPAAAAAPVRLPALKSVYPVERKRPAATVLLEAATETNAYGPLIIMAEHTVGRGRVLYVGSDMLWRWQTAGPRAEDGTTLYAIFWQQALRALAPAEPSAAATQLWLRPEQTHYHVGERVRVAVESVVAADRVPPTVEAIVVLPDGRRLPLDLSADGRSPNQFTATFEATTEGRYRIEATARTDTQTTAEVSTVIEISARTRSEADDTTVDVGVLARLASSTGGRVIDPTAADGWLPTTAPATTAVVRWQPIDLWHNFTLLFVLCALMAADWSLRLFRGYT